MKILASMAALVLALGVGACTDQARNDATITASVNRKLTDQQTPGNIVVATQKGVVTLTGSVPDQQVKDRAEGIVKTTSGVQGVVNHLNTTMAGDAPFRPRDIPGAANPPANPPGGIPPQLAPPGGVNIPRPAPHPQ